MAVTVVAGAIIAVTGGLASADTEYPSESDIEDAQEVERKAQDAVEAAEARLTEMEAELDELHIAAGLLVEAYNGARIALQDAEATEAEAFGRAEEAATEKEAAREDLGRFAASSYRTGGQLVTLSAILDAGEPDDLLSAAEALNSVTRSQSEVYTRWIAAADDAEDAALNAAAALDDRQDAEEQAKEAYEDAEAAIAEHSEALAAIEAERDELVERLAEARGTTVELERQRQAGIEAEERERRAREERQRAAEEEAARAAERESSEPTPEPTAAPTTDAPEPEPEPEPSGSSAVEKVIAYAHDQVGKPYQWGASGPDSFDCSGLTMRAWEQGGVSLSHWSVAQANETTRVSYSDLRPGDLIFWSNNGEPSGVHHVGLYIGDGKMIHAPSTGKTVEVQDIFYWTTPSFYGRV